MTRLGWSQYCGAMTTGLLELHGITKSYGDRKALDNVSFDVTPGRLTGFVGGNGAGKTTTVRIVLGVLGKDSGEVLLGGSPVSATDRRRFGYMPEERGLYPKMKVLEQGVYLARLHGFGKADATARATALLEELEHIRGAGRHLSHLVYLSCDVGVGGGVIVEGLPMRGASGYAGEVGHQRFDNGSARCRCGNTGCWETEIGSHAVAEAVGCTAASTWTSTAGSCA